MYTICIRGFDRVKLVIATPHTSHIAVSVDRFSATPLLQFLSVQSRLDHLWKPWEFVLDKGSSSD